MKRVLIATVGTIAGLVALLDFKSHGTAVSASGAGLPSASLPQDGSSSTSTAPTTTPSSSQSNPSQSSSAGGTTSRSATGDAIQTRYGTVQVRVTVSGSRITNVAFVELTADDGRSQQINQDAAPILLRETLSAQSAQVDTVSGASYTTDGYRQSLQSALDQLGIK